MPGWGQPRARRASRAVALSVAVLVAFGSVLAAPVAALAAHKSSASATSSAPTATAAASPTATAASGSGGAAALPGSTNPLSGGVPLSPATTPTSATPTVVNTSTNGNGSSSLSSASALVIVIGAAVVLGGIAFFIWRDARRRAPVRADAALAGEGRRAGSKAPPKSRKLSAAERKRRKRGRAR
jgi:hypothetical protein